MSYLNQLKTHKASLEITIQQCENDIEHNRKNLELLESQKETTQRQIALISQAIADEENKDA
jgi:predicted  nucleic acid-binding Zn-ribbon protein